VAAGDKQINAIFGYTKKQQILIKKQDFMN
jgi:hypothetical protein